MFDTRKFGSFLADLRKSADMTQSELGDRLNLTRQAISRYECGDSFPDISVLGDIARIFGVPVELLISSGDPTVGEAGIINAVASGRDITPQDVSDVVSLAPLLKPSVLSKLAESLSKNGLDLSGLLSRVSVIIQPPAHARRSWKANRRIPRVPSRGQSPSPSVRSPFRGRRLTCTFQYSAYCTNLPYLLHP